MDSRITDDIMKKAEEHAAAQLESLKTSTAGKEKTSSKAVHNTDLRCHTADIHSDNGTHSVRIPTDFFYRLHRIRRSPNT